MNILLQNQIKNPNKWLSAFKLCFLILILFSPWVRCFSQNHIQHERLSIIYRKHFASNVDKIKIKEQAVVSRSDLSVLSISLIKFYKKYISSQDSKVCNFKESCSSFGLKAIRTYGFPTGYLITGDRLLRCNGLSRKYYKIDPKTKLAIDYPLQYYQFR